MGLLRHLAVKELKTLLRERIIIMMIIMPLVIYPVMGSAMGAAIRQTVDVVQLKGVKIAVDGLGEGCVAAKALAELIRRGNVTVYAYCNVDPVKLVEEKRFDIVMVVRGGILDLLLKGRPVNITVYLRGGLGGFTRLMSLPAVVPQVLTKAVGGERRSLVNVTAFVVLKGRVWSFERLQAVFSTGMSLLYGVFILGFFAASIAAVVIGAEREERMLETLLSLPVPRRDIVVSKIIAALVVACVAASSTLLGLYMMMTGMGAPTARMIALQAYTIADLAVYVVGVAATVFMITSLAMLLSMFASTIRGAQAVAGIAALPLLAVILVPFLGVPGGAAYLAPYIGFIYTAFSPLVGVNTAIAAAASQLVYALILVAILVKLVSSEVAITGPETIKKLLGRRMRRRLPG